MGNFSGTSFILGVINLTIINAQKVFSISGWCSVLCFAQLVVLGNHRRDIGCHDATGRFLNTSSKCLFLRPPLFAQNKTAPSFLFRTCGISAQAQGILQSFKEVYLCL